MRRGHQVFAGTGLENAVGVVYHPVAWAARVLAVVRRMDALDDGHAAFITLSDDHDSVTITHKALREIGGVPLLRAFSAWADAPPGREGFCVSRPRAGATPWFHNDDGNQGYADPGADPTFNCPTPP
jgi:hypothetical protein